MVSFLEKIVYFVVCVDIYLVFRSLIGLKWGKEYLSKIKAVKVNEYPNLIILLPALREQPIVKSTINWFSDLKYPKEKLKIIIATTEKEEYEYSISNCENVVTTSMLVEQEIKRVNSRIGYERFLHIHYPKIDGNKSLQMNYAIDQYLEGHEICFYDKTYIAVYDFDSMPGDSTLQYVASVANKYEYPDVLQQVPLNFKNFCELSKSRKNSLILLQGIHHSIRSIGIELFRLLIYAKGITTTAFYCMGAGMFIRLDSLLKYDKFPKVIDDISLGYKYSINKLKFYPIPSFNLVELPHKTKLLFNQRVLIFKGILTSFEEVKTAIRAKKSPLRTVLVFMEGLLNTLSSTIFPWIVLLYFGWLIMNRNFGAIFWLILIVPYVWTLTGFVILRDLRKSEEYKMSTLFLVFLISPLWKLCKTFGSWIYIKRYIISKISNTEIKYKKTERV